MRLLSDSLSDVPSKKCSGFERLELCYAIFCTQAFVCEARRQFDDNVGVPLDRVSNSSFPSMQDELSEESSQIISNIRLASHSQIDVELQRMQLARGAGGRDREEWHQVPGSGSPTRQIGGCSVSLHFPPCRLGTKKRLIVLGRCMPRCGVEYVEKRGVNAAVVTQQMML